MPKTDNWMPGMCMMDGKLTINGWMRALAAVLILLSGVCLLSVSSADAAGANPVREMSDTVEVLCPKLKELSGDGLLNPAEEDVFLRCREVKIPPGETFEDLGAADLNALRDMTSEQTSSMSRMTVELAGPQIATITGRLQALRAGTGGGLALNLTNEPEEPLLFAGPVTSLPAAESSPWVDQRLGIFINGALGTGSRDATLNERGFDFDAYTITAGADYRLTDNLILGGAFGYARTQADVNLDAGDVDADGYGFSLFGTYYVGELYFDIIGVYAKRDFSIVRNVRYDIASFGGGTTRVNQAFTGDPDADEFGFAAGVGYSINKGGVTLQPYANVNYLDTDIDGYTESLGAINTDPGFGLALRVDDQSVTSLISTFGGRLSYSLPTRTGVFIPQLSFDWKHEFKNDARTLIAHFVNGTGDPDNVIAIPTDDPDEDYFGLGLGVSAVFPRGISAFVYYDTLIDLAEVSYHQVTLGVRFEL